MKEQVLKAMREFGAPVGAGKIAEITGKEGAIVSPVRCKWEPSK
ncbi:MAG: transcriptional regulator [Bacteroidales bacterium]|nr:transcriptional regulator [Bacteroidales bacterium]